jgi:protein SCO1/2
MATSSSLTKRVVLLILLVLPFLVYFIFVYNSEENFFQTLDYVGPPQVTAEGDSVPYQIPPFGFTNQYDTTVTSQDLRGQLYVANFFFTSCPTVCPAMNYQVQQIQERFENYEQFRILSFSVDPEHDTPAVLRDYAQKMKAQPGRWHFLTGPKDSIYNTAPDYFLNALEDSAAPGGFMHSQYLVLVDWQGRIRSRRDDRGNLKGVYDGTSQTEVNKLKDDIKVLIAEYEKWKSVQEYEASKEAQKMNER